MKSRNGRTQSKNLHPLTRFGWALPALFLWPCMNYAGNLVTLESEYLGGGIFEYRLSCTAEPYVEKCGLDHFGLAFPGFNGVVQEPEDWQREVGFPTSPQSAATLQWFRDQTDGESLPYGCVFRVQSDQTSFRLGTVEITNVLHWHDWAQPPDYREHIQETLMLNCLVPCGPEQSDGSPPFFRAAGSDFPEPQFTSYTVLAPQNLLLGISARAGLPLSIEGSGDLSSWFRVGFREASTTLTFWPISTVSDSPQFYRAVVQNPGFAHPEDLASTQWLEAHLGDPSVRITDIRYPQSDAAFRSGHIPGAVMIDPNDLKDPTHATLWMVPTPAQFEALMSQFGISNATTVVVYDTDGGLWCARLWWALRYYGHENVKILHGGLGKWQREMRPVETEVVLPPAASFAAEVHPEFRATFDEVQAAMDDPNITILNSLSTDHHTGVRSDMPSLPAGHIPSAKNVASASVLTPDFVLPLPPEALAARYEAAGVMPDKEVITYCGGGYYGAFNLFVLHQLGYENVRLYEGSWSEWVFREGAIETGP